MFDDGSSIMNNLPHSDEPRPEESAEEKLQYTIKGIERRSVDLMRDAAKQDGMKIGVWVSRRMREAAEASLVGRTPSYISNDRSGESQRSEIPTEHLLEVIQSLQKDIEAIRESQNILISGLISKARD